MKKFSHKNFLAFLAVILISLAVTYCGTAVYTRSVSSSLQDEIIVSLGEISEKSADTIRKEIRSGVNELSDVALLIGQLEEFEPEKILNRLKSVLKNNDYKRFGIILPDGTAYTTDHQNMNLADRPYFQSGMQGNTGVSDTLTDKIGGEDINVYSAPVIRDGAIIGVLFATYSTENYQSTLETRFFAGAGYSYVVKSNGDSVVASNHPESFPDFQNVLGSLRMASPDNEGVAQQLQEEMGQNKSGCLRFWNKADKYMYYLPLGVNDWYLLMVVPATAVEGKMNRVVGWSYLLGGVLTGLYSLLLFYVLATNAKNRRQLEQIAFVDELTGGMSISKFKAAAADQLAQNDGRRWAVACLDVDQFKYINDVFGYQEGNDAILYLYRHLLARLGQEEQLAHISGDHFAMLLSFADHAALEERISRICREPRIRKTQRENQYELILSVGVYEVEDRRLDVDAMMDRAEIARKTIKGRHPSSYAFFDETLRSKLIQEKKLENRMGPALANGEFVAYFQPQYRVADSALTGAEALVRWVTPDGNIIPPGQFVPLFESNGFITELDKAIFRQVCQRIRQWMDKGYPVVPVSVNLSRLHLYHPDFIEEYCRIREEFSIPARLIQLEITENMVFDSPALLTGMIARMRSQGFAVLMDDFGTGYSSLNMLKDIPVDVLKLDKGFIEGAADSPKGRQIIASVIRLAQSLQIKVVAEGIETEEEFCFLREVGCDEIQVFYFARPMPAEEYEMLLQEQPDKSS